jgi:hypothetical protein
MHRFNGSRLHPSFAEDLNFASSSLTAAPAEITSHA